MSCPNIRVTAQGWVHLVANIKRYKNTNWSNKTRTKSALVSVFLLDWTREEMCLHLHLPSSLPPSRPPSSFTHDLSHSTSISMKDDHCKSAFLFLSHYLSFISPVSLTSSFLHMPSSPLLYALPTSHLFLCVSHFSSSPHCSRSPPPPWPLYLIALPINFHLIIIKRNEKKRWLQLIGAGAEVWCRCVCV